MIIDLAPTACPEKVDAFATSRGIPIVHVVSQFRAGASGVQLRVPPIFGPSYRDRDCINRRYHQCFRNLPPPDEECAGTAAHALSSDVAGYIVELIESYRRHSRLPANSTIEWTRRTFGDRDLSAAISASFPKCRVGWKTTGKFPNSAMTALADTLIPNLSAPYITHVTAISDLSRVVHLYQLGLDNLARILERFPLISIEFICVFAPVSEMAFESLFKVPKLLQKYLKVVYVPPVFQAQMKARTNGPFFPEYMLRNIGVRRALGEYIFCRSSDVLIPPGFFPSAERRLFSPLSYVRSKRDYIEPFEIAQTLQSFDTKLFASFHWLDTEEGYETLAASILVEACGDFQGAHRLMWTKTQGYIEAKEIYHVDSALALDFSTFLVPLLVKFLPGEKHVIHVKISIFTPHLTAFSLYNRDFMYNHLPSRVLWPRDNWGAFE
jgi:hypothetical protein